MCEDSLPVAWVVAGGRRELWTYGKKLIWMTDMLLGGVCDPAQWIENRHFASIF